MSITGPAAPPPPRARRRRRTWQERRRRRGAAFDLLAVAAALALVGLGLANLALTATPELAVRQAMCTRRSRGSMPQPTAPAMDSSSAVTGRIPASSAASMSARRSSAVDPTGAPTTARTRAVHARLPTFRRTECRYSRATSRSVTTPS